MNVLIIEDEIPSQLNLQRALSALYADIRVVGSLGSVAEAVDWIKANPSGADLIFMDVQLSDGLCFDIFKQCAIDAKVVITTAYDSYALDAFKVQSVDYLLKPIETEALRRAVDHCRSLNAASQQIDYAKLAEAFAAPRKAPAKDRFLIKIGDKIIVVRVENISYFFSEDKTSYLVVDPQHKYIIDESLDAIESKLDKKSFFRICRSCIVSVHSIVSVSKHFSSRLKVKIKDEKRDDLFVSRARTAEFLEWLNGE